MRRVAVAALSVLALGGGCGDASGEEPAQQATRDAGGAGTTVTTGVPAENSEPLEPARCPAAEANCRSASGTIIYIERVDPDGDGDAHFVLASTDSITAPGLSVIDVRKGLRPEPLPGLGDRVSAAGPVFTGSYGQRQIHAHILNVAR